MASAHTRTAAALIVLVMLPAGLVMSYANWKSSEIEASTITWADSTLTSKLKKKQGTVFCAIQPGWITASCTSANMEKHCEVLQRARVNSQGAITGLTVGFQSGRIISLRQGRASLCNLDGIKKHHRHTAFWGLAITLLLTSGLAVLAYLPTGSTSLRR